LDLAFGTSYRLSEFFTGRETPNTLHNLVTALQRRRNSYLAQAMATDLDLYEENLDRPTRAERAPDLVEVDLATSLLMGVHELLQQVVWFTASAAPKKAGRPKITRLPRPKTAKHLYEAAQTAAALEHLDSVIRYVPEIEWRKTIAEAGGERWPPTTPEPPPSTSSPA
jgi:hypothetical protein